MNSNQPSNSQTEWSPYRELDALVCDWENTGQPPELLGVLSSGQFSAVCIAARKERELDSPLRAFLLLEDPLQRWILDRRGMSRFVGKKIGGERI